MGVIPHPGTDQWAPSFTIRASDEPTLAETRAQARPRAQHFRGTQQARAK